MADKNCGILTTALITPVFFQKSFAKTLICVTIIPNTSSGGKSGFIRLCRAFDELLSSKAGEKYEKKIKSFGGGCF